MNSREKRTGYILPGSRTLRYLQTYKCRSFNNFTLLATLTLVNECSTQLIKS